MGEETGARIRAEGRVVEVEKQCSMLEFDLKQSVQKMEQLMKQKERLEDEVSKLLMFMRCWIYLGYHKYSVEDNGFAHLCSGLDKLGKNIIEYFLLKKTLTWVNIFPLLQWISFN